CARLGSEYW
nr:immunoglobulin heavy chain junction region [Homo sapiens]MOM25354.1 immunoglobulin heavy chain junction region [Homo sapiens]MOM42027.1 immunoglobulin heavy chain junction region [Homo sapiens]